MKTYNLTVSEMHCKSRTLTTESEKAMTKAGIQLCSPR